MKVWKHAVVILVALFLCLGVPGLSYWHANGGAADGVSRASMEIPDQPSGEFLVLMNTDRHASSMADWTAFFTEQEVGVIFEDLSCLVMDADVTGAQLADRYQARLAENQMTVTAENATLVASRAEAGVFDVIIVSKEMADALSLRVSDGVNHTAVIPITGGSE